MEQFGAVAEEPNITAAVEDAVIPSVTEKHEIEEQEKSFSCDNSLSEVLCEDTSELSVKSPKEDGEVSSARCLFFSDYWNIFVTIGIVDSVVLFFLVITL